MFRRLQTVAGASFGPIIVSALSFIISFSLIHNLALLLHPSFSLFALNGVGKIAVMTAALVQALCLVAIQPKSLFMFFRHAATWPFYSSCMRTFLQYAGSFALLHLIVLGGYFFTGHASFNAYAIPQLLTRWPLVLLCVIGTFFLAWAEELLFRGLIYPYFRQHYSMMTSAIIASTIFMLLHDLHNPLSLVTYQWQLGLGLFLLGLFLNLVMVWQKSIAAGAGVHAGLVVVKAILRKIHILPLAAGSPYLFPIDLRQSLFVHLLLSAGIAFVWNKMTKKAS